MNHSYLYSNTRNFGMDKLKENKDLLKNLFERGYQLFRLLYQQQVKIITAPSCIQTQCFLYFLRFFNFQNFFYFFCIFCGFAFFKRFFFLFFISRIFFQRFSEIFLDFFSTIFLEFLVKILKMAELFDQVQKRTLRYYIYL